MRFLRVRGAFDDMPPLPEPVAETLALVERDPSFDWVPETRYVALLLAVHDHAFPGDSPGFLDWLSEASAERVAVTDQDSELLRGSVQQLLEAAPSVWARYRRGTCSQLERIAAGEAVILLPHPTALFPRVVLEYFARTLETALARVDAANPCVRVDTLDLGGDRAETRFLVSWDAPGVQRT